jgi:hypothetical protein
MRTRILALALTFGALLVAAPAADAASRSGVTVPPLCVKLPPLQLGYCPA